MKNKAVLTMTALAAIQLIALTGCQSPNVNDNVPHTTIKGTIAGQPFSIENPKDTILEGLDVNAAPGGAASIKISKLSTVMNPASTSATGEAGAALIREYNAGVHQNMQDAGALLEKGAAAVKTVAP